MISAFWKWLTQFDIIKGIILGIAVIISSWYDLRAEVRENRGEATQLKIDMARIMLDQEKKDAMQDAVSAERYRSLQEAIKQLHDDIRADRRNNWGRK